MHIHKINPNSQEHRSFLSQNRKDPITGDSILEGDEVVFCAGCKSVFLKDTWEYLGSQHCEQRGTLVDFPFNFTNLTIQKTDLILFYEQLPLEGQKKGSKIPSRLDPTIWKYKEGELASYEYDFYLTPIFYAVIAFGFVMGIIGCILLESFFPIGGSVIFSILLTLIAAQEENTQAKKLKTAHKYFYDNVFYISKTGIGFSRRYGRQEYILSIAYIHSLEFQFSYSFFASNYCIIEDINGNKTKFLITNYLEENKTTQFLEALHSMNQEAICSIKIQIEDNALLCNILENEIQQNGYAISILRK
ncbi:hypothetical protein V9L05_00820 [Bernardetia sp. Wsw4-3y2]|uniref:hypothetical protein n=1 Tax=Bernardetia sp. Wsw4-3y2 TaxID=3127471 RepID=UPI0030CF7C98